MARRVLTRRTLLAAPALLGLAAAARASDVVDLTWNDLVPGEDALAMEALRGVVEHGQIDAIPDQPEASGVTTAFDGRRVRLPGYIVPLAYDGTAVTTFILVPYVGACVHVPPPPANQLVLVDAAQGYEDPQLFEAVAVTGTFGTAATSTALAEIGYTLDADRVEPYRG